MKLEHTDSPAVIAAKFASSLLIEGRKRGAAHRAWSEIERLANDPSVSPEARAIYASFLKEHSQDSDCTLGDDGCCIVCRVEHGEDCPDCGRFAYHKEGCRV